jgi:phage tail-like protein
MTTMTATARLGLSARFVVDIQGFSLGGWAKCEGLAVTFKLHDYKPFGMNEYSPILPDRLEYEHISLSRAVTADDTPKVMQWLAGLAKGKSRPDDATITLLDSQQLEVVRWKLRHPYPTKWKGPSLDATAHNVAVEVLELAHEGFLGD